MKTDFEELEYNRAVPSRLTTHEQETTKRETSEPQRCTCLHMLNNIKCLAISLMLTGCVDLADPVDDPTNDASLQPTTSTTEQTLVGVRTAYADTRSFGGDIAAKDYYYSIGSRCSGGHFRVQLSGDPTTQWSGGGYCGFYAWASPSDLGDCTAIIHAHTNGWWSGGTCSSQVHEAMIGFNGYTYEVANTLNATTNTADIDLPLSAGETISFGTYGLPGAQYVGDTYLVLHYPMEWPFFGAMADWSDDVAPGILGSKIDFTAPVSGIYRISGGCFANTACFGDVYSSRWLGAY